jgi:hypothetical protein
MKNHLRQARVAIVVGALALGLLEPRATRAGRWDAIDKIAGQTAITVVVKNKRRTYFRITPAMPLTLQLEGPIRLRVVSRVDLPPDSKQSVSYHFKVLEGDQVLDEQTTESSLSNVVKLAEGNRPVGKGRRLVTDIPAGKHRITLTVEGVPAVFVRLHEAAPRTEAEMVTLTPLEAPRSILCREGERTIPYFSVFPSKPVRLRVVGPTNLDLITRLDFDARMRGTQVYRLKISDGKRTIREVEFETTKATTATYSNLPDRVPSKFDRLQLPIADGQHEIMVELLKPIDGSAEIHPRIPQPEIGSEE